LKTYMRYSVKRILFYCGIKAIYHSFYNLPI